VFIAILAASENLPITKNTPGGHSHMQQIQPEFFEGLSFGGVEVSCIICCEL
jgi:hypothetical protein